MLDSSIFIMTLHWHHFFLYNVWDLWYLITQSIVILSNLHQVIGTQVSMAMLSYHITCESNFTDGIHPTGLHGLLRTQICLMWCYILGWCVTFGVRFSNKISVNSSLWLHPVHPMWISFICIEFTIGQLWRFLFIHKLPMSKIAHKIPLLVPLTLWPVKLVIYAPDQS